MDRVTVIIINRKTLAHTQECLESLLQFYPYIHILLIDNRSGSDPSLDYVKLMASTHPNIDCLLITSGEPHHARGLNAGLADATTRYILTLDSDVVVLRGGWIERMVGAFVSDKKLFAVGHLCRNAGRDCIRPPVGGHSPYRFIHPFCAMWDRARFASMRFGYTGQPACHVCINAEHRGLHLKDFPGIHPKNIGDDLYVRHKWGGTRDRLAILADQRRRKKRRK